MKNPLQLFLIVIFMTVFSASHCHAKFDIPVIGQIVQQYPDNQDAPPDDDPQNDPVAPIDSNLVFLLVAGVGLAFYAKRKKLSL